MIKSLVWFLWRHTFKADPTRTQNKIIKKSLDYEKRWNLCQISREWLNIYLWQQLFQILAYRYPNNWFQTQTFLAFRETWHFQKFLKANFKYGNSVLKLQSKILKKKAALVLNSNFFFLHCIFSLQLCIFQISELLILNLTIVLLKFYLKIPK